MRDWVFRLGNLLKGMHPASSGLCGGGEGVAVGSMQTFAVSGSSAPICALPTAPVERASGSSPSFSEQGFVGQAPFFAEPYEDDEVVFEWDS